MNQEADRIANAPIVASKIPTTSQMLDLLEAAYPNAEKLRRAINDRWNACNARNDGKHYLRIDGMYELYGEVIAKKRSKIRVEFLTGQYRFSHMQEPRGRGSWALEVSGKLIDRSDLAAHLAMSNDAYHDLLSLELNAGKMIIWTPGNMLLSDAKKRITEIVRGSLSFFDLRMAKRVSLVDLENDRLVVEVEVLP